MGPTANEALRDAFIRHQIYLLRYSSFVRNKMAAFLDRTEEPIAERIIGKLANVKGLTTPAGVERMTALLAWIRLQRNAAWDEATTYLVNEMIQLAKQEPVYAQGILTLHSPVVLDLVLPSATLLKSIVMSRPFEGRLLKDWASTMQAEDLRRISAAIQMGMLSGESSSEISRRVIGTGAMQNRDGATEMTRRHIQAITRTAVQHVANNARDEVFEENADVVEAELFVATLDSRTTAICRGLDGKVFPHGKGPRPPLHMGCRSLRVAYFGKDSIGSRPAKSSTEKQVLKMFTEERGIDPVSSRDDLPRGTKGAYDVFERKTVREMTGRVPAATSYNTWLKSQTVVFQDEILGISKGKLFRAGLTLDKFVAANGTELTLPQLSKKYKSLFEAAGLNIPAFT